MTNTMQYINNNPNGQKPIKNRQRNILVEVNNNIEKEPADGLLSVVSEHESNAEQSAISQA